MRRPALLTWVTAGAVVLWIAVFLVLVTGDWGLSCTVDGSELGGIDCLQTNALPEATTRPARWFGFGPLVGAWVGASAVLVWCALARRRLVRRRAYGLSSALDRRSL